MRIIRTHEDDLDALTKWEKDQCYNGLDCAVTIEAFNGMLPQLDSHTAATYEFSKALQAPVLEMRLRGCLVDAVRKADVIEEMFEASERLEADLLRIVFDGVGLPTFNWRSHADLQRLLYDALDLDPIRRSGRPTTDRGARERLEVYPLATQIIKHINLLTELGDKISVLRTDIDSDGRIRTSYNIAGTSTGRFSSSLSEFGTGGNLQNIEESLRSILVADPGYKFAKFDAKSGESFCVGAIEWNLFGDGRFLDACESGDPHTAVARLCWPTLPWTGNLQSDKELAEQPYYRHYTYRFMCKKLGHGCLTPDHEVLTPDGWVPITDKPPAIMTWTDNRSEFQLVSSWIDFEYTGQLQAFEGNSISLLATHDHRIPYKKDTRYGTCETIAKNGPQSKMPLGSGWIGGAREVPARLIAAYMCDGSLEKYNITFHFSKERKVRRLQELLEVEGIEYTIYDNVDNTYKIVMQKFDWPKHPGAFMFEWSIECIEDFIDELKWWDGYHGPTSITISSRHREDLEWYQTFARLIGIGGQIQQPQLSGFGTVIYRLQQNNRKWASGQSIKWSHVDVTNERVLCPTVLASWFYVRRNGKIFITGNSNYGGKPHTLAEQAKLPVSVVAEFQPKYFAAFPSHERWQAWVDDQLRRAGFLISLTGRKRWFFGRRNDPATLREAIAYDPQCSLADIVNRAMLSLWRQNLAIIMFQDHDALTFMYPEAQEDAIVPQLQAALVVPISLANGRTLRIPYDAEVGWNKGKWCCGERKPECKGCQRVRNLDGLQSWTGHDERRRTPAVSILDRVVQNLRPAKVG